VINNKEHRLTGLLYAFSGIFLMSFDSLLIRLAGVSGWTTSFYRGIFIFIIIGVIFVRKNRKNFTGELKRGGVPLLVSGILWGFSSLFFVQGVKLTSVAILSFFPLKRLWVQ
jgi:hypothetical protein